MSCHSDSRGGFWRNPISLTECHGLQTLQIDCVEKNIVTLIETLDTLQDVSLECLRIGFHLVTHPTSPSSVTCFTLGRLDVLLHDYFLRRILQRIRFDIHFYGVKEPVEQHVYTGYAVKLVEHLPKIRGVPPEKREVLSYLHVQAHTV